MQLISLDHSSSFNVCLMNFSLFTYFNRLLSYDCWPLVKSVTGSLSCLFNEYVWRINACMIVSVLCLTRFSSIKHREKDTDRWEATTTRERNLGHHCRYFWCNIKDRKRQISRTKTKFDYSTVPWSSVKTQTNEKYRKFIKNFNTVSNIYWILKEIIDFFFRYSLKQIHHAKVSTSKYSHSTHHDQPRTEYTSFSMT